ncbi:MAG: ribulose-5-phosphate 4-epimerase/fuculose-1-phosphate aldolase [Alphaproteobacteria bacterium]|jgi:ribulose-5-phosphate 4-epimerase/fuculose-1-phosphate aldolase
MASLQTVDDFAPLNEIQSLRTSVSAAEWETRVNLAACYRLVDLYDMSDMTRTHISAKVPGEEAFLLNPFGLMFNEITASSLIKVDIDGNPLSESLYKINPAGYTIHSAVHSGREDAKCVLHTHSIAGMAISALECGLLSISQHAMRFHNRLAYHDYEGLAFDLTERDRLLRDLGAHSVMILRNHGLLAAGRTIDEAFSLIYYLEKCARSQLQAMASGAKLVIPSDEVCEHAAKQFEKNVNLAIRDWPGHLRRLDAMDPGYRD